MSSLTTAFRRVGESHTLVILLTVLSLAAAKPLAAQVIPWSAGGVSLGGGRLSLSGTSTDPLTAAVRPDSPNSGVVLGGAWAAIGTERFSVILPEIRAAEGGNGGKQRLDGQVALGDQVVSFEKSDQSYSELAVLFGVRAKVPNTRFWVRGEAGAGWFTRSIADESGHVTINLSTGTGLALFGVAGYNVWRREHGWVLTLDAEVNYLQVRMDGGRARLPGGALTFSAFARR